jgi:hypothetical protein
MATTQNPTTFPPPLPTTRPPPPPLPTTPPPPLPNTLEDKRKKVNQEIMGLFNDWKKTQKFVYETIKKKYKRRNIFVRKTKRNNGYIYKHLRIVRVLFSPIVEITDTLHSGYRIKFPLDYERDYRVKEKCGIEVMNANKLIMGKV